MHLWNSILVQLDLFLHLMIAQTLIGLSNFLIIKRALAIFRERP